MGDRPGAGVSELNPLAEVRQARMAGIIWDEGFARVTDLAGRFGVSAVTVRADLTALEARARVRRVRGGAVPPSGLLGERPFESSQWEAPLQKSSIGVHAAGMIAAGDTVILDVGTTTTAIARALVLRTELHDVTVVTNGLNIALELERATPRISVVVTGGTLRPLQHSLVNPLGTTLLERLHASVAFVGCNGVDPEVGITNVNLPEAEVKRAMLLAARRRVIVADGSKIGEVELAKVCDIEEVSLLITDPTADPEVVAEIAAAGCQVELRRLGPNDRTTVRRSTTTAPERHARRRHVPSPVGVRVPGQSDPAVGGGGRPQPARLPQGHPGRRGGPVALQPARRLRWRRRRRWWRRQRLPGGDLRLQPVRRGAQEGLRRHGGGLGR